MAVQYWETFSHIRLQRRLFLEAKAASAQTLERSLLSSDSKTPMTESDWVWLKVTPVDLFHCVLKSLCWYFTVGNSIPRNFHKSCNSLSSDMSSKSMHIVNTELFKNINWESNTASLAMRVRAYDSVTAQVNWLKNDQYRLPEVEKVQSFDGRLLK